MNSGRASARNPSICFVAHFAYGELAGSDNGHAGGIERQQTLMARWLAQRGYTVKMLTWDEGQPDGETIGGVQVLKMCRWDEGLRGLRFLHPRWTSLWRALKRADVDIVYYNCGDLGLGQVAMWCHRHGRKCVYSVASNVDCDARLPALRSLRERVLYRYGLRHAHRIITQTQSQRRMLRQSFRLESVVLPMPCDAGDADGLPELHTPAAADIHVLWVGRFSHEKRLEWFLDVAERCPRLRFDVVGAANAASAYASQLETRATRLPNVRLHGRLPRTRMWGFYEKAALLCCTSAYEGFPNTFLEAWSQGVPVVSTFDPDGIIATHGCGAVAASVEELVEGLNLLLTSRSAWRSASSAGRQYYRENHMLDSVMLRFESVFQQVADN